MRTIVLAILALSLLAPASLAQDDARSFRYLGGTAFPPGVPYEGYFGVCWDPPGVSAPDYDVYVDGPVLGGVCGVEVDASFDVTVTDDIMGPATFRFRMPDDGSGYCPSGEAGGSVHIEAPQGCFLLDIFLGAGATMGTIVIE